MRAILNWIWAGFFLVAFLAGLYRWLVLGDAGVWASMVGSTFDMAKTGFEVSLGLTGVMCLWLGISSITLASLALALLWFVVREAMVVPRVVFPLASASLRDASCNLRPRSTDL